MNKEETMEYKKLSPEQQEYYKIQQEKEAYKYAFYNKFSMGKKFFSQRLNMHFKVEFSMHLIKVW